MATKKTASKKKAPVNVFSTTGEVFTITASQAPVEEIVMIEEVVPMLPPNLSVDYASEGLNNMARTINEILTFLRYGQK